MHEMPDGQMMADKDMPPQESAGEGNQVGEQPNVTPEEQKEYDSLFTAAIKSLYDENRIPMLLKKLGENRDNISTEIGHTAAMILSSLKGGIQEQEGDVSDDVLFEVGQDVVGELCHIAVAAKLMDESRVNDVASAALFEGMRVWGKHMQDSGAITDDISAQAAADLEERGVPPAEQAPEEQQPMAPEGQPMPPQGGLVNSAMGA
jgi:hypothetical protein